MRSDKVALATIIHVGDRLLSRILDFAGALLVARILAPEAFGVVMIGVAALTMARGITEFPVANALIQKENVDDSDYATAFTLTNARGLVIALGLCSVAWFLSRVYDEPSVMPIIYCLAIAPLATGFASPMMASHLRDMNFIPLAIASLSGKVIGFAVTAFIILTTGSFWALVAGIVISPVVTTILTYWLAPSPITFSLKHWREFFAFSSWMSLAGGVLIAYSDGTKFVIGLFVNAAALGVYAVGYSIAQTAIWALAGPTIQTFFVGFTKIQNDRPRLQRAYLRSQSVLVTVFMPIGFGLILISDPLVNLLLGPEWSEASFVLAWLAPGMAYLVAASPAQAISMAVNQTRAMFFRNLTVAVISLPLLIYGAAYYGLYGAVVARLFGSILNTFAGFILVKQLVGVSFIKQMLSGWRSIVAALIMVGVSFAGLSDFFDLAPGATIALFVNLVFYIAANATVFFTALVGLWIASGRPEGPETLIFDMAFQHIKKWKVTR